jgi:hypothetical protein
MIRHLLNLAKTFIIGVLLGNCITSFINSEYYIFSIELSIIVHLIVFELKTIMREHVKDVEGTKIAAREVERERLERGKQKNKI